MPIYAYKCESCGHRQDVLQKLSDPLLTQCPACQAATFVKQVTAAGFQLKGSGWYVTDFRDGGKKPAAADAAASGESGASGDGAADKAGKPGSDAGGSSAASEGKPAEKSAEKASAPAPAPAAPSPAPAAPSPAA